MDLLISLLPWKGLKSICLSQQSSTYRGTDSPPTRRLAPAQDRQVFSQAWGKRAGVEGKCLSWTQLCAPQKDTEESCPVQLCGLCTLHSGRDSHMGSPKSCHAWSRVWHGLCTALSICSIIAFPDGLHPDHIVYRERKNGN